MLDPAATEAWRGNKRTATRLFHNGQYVDAQPVFFQDGLRDCPVYDRNKLGAESRFVCPAIVTQLDATTLVGPGWG